MHMHIYIYLHMHIYICETSKPDLWILAALRLQEFKGSILISTPAVAQINVNIWRTSFPSPNGSRTEFMPNTLDRSTANSVSRLFHTPGIMEAQRKIKQIMHLHFKMLVKSMKVDFGWVFWHPRPVLWMPDGPYKPPDALIHVQNLKDGPKRIGTSHGDPWLPKVSPNPVAHIYIYMDIYIYIYR